MGSRERKRAELQRRKERAATRVAPVGSSPETGAPAEPPPREPSRSALKDREAREALVPLGEGERPLVVTIGAGVSALLALSVLVGWATGAKVNGAHANPIQVIVPTALMGTMAWGMWRVRYWAALGFQTVMLILILVCSLALLTATSIPKAIGNAAVVTIAGTLFYFMVKALARIQMPSSARGR